MPLSGSCLCGAVRYQSSASPLFSGNCYCSDCRRESGGGHVTAVSVPNDSVSVIGTVATFSKAGASGKLIERSFCPRCGTTLYARPELRPGLTMLRAGTLDDASAVAPSVNLYTSRAPAWDPPNPSLRGFPEMPPLR
jgi:hypothetical protein